MINRRALELSTISTLYLQNTPCKTSETVYIFLATWHKLKIVIDLQKLQHLIVFIANFYDKILNA